ncbi:LuxR C-terminal-related transcriptional regulator [Chryseobacterium cucumeris]|uniref:LuxR C-terminal-related transcriptional regulator n=1 Tax=Chryseobacterium cucumeris TaxID=1813611 RepID=UPI002453F228|nr:LuxR C-terminal-related transcriptional regulator [Chryseobacterium cucumeris]MDH5032895.1 LuxR C-terminal-related transcriptional regulator [Chryseobacterium cucumeris]
MLIKVNEDLRISGRKKELIDLNNKFCNISKKQDYKKGEILSYINLGNIYATVGMYEKAFKYLQVAEENLEGIDDYYLHTKLYQEYGQANYVIGLYKKAVKYNSKSIYYGKQIKDQHDREILSLVYANRADFLRESNSIDSSLIYLHKALEIKPTPVINSTIANHYMLFAKNEDSAQMYFNRAFSLLKQREYWDPQRALTYFYYGNFLFERQDYTSALDYYIKSVEILKKTRRVYQIPMLYQTIAKTYKKLNNASKEKDYLERYAKLNDSLGRVRDESINNSVDKITREKEKDDIDQQNSTILYNVIIFSLFFIIIIVYYVYNKRITKKRKIIEEKELETELLMKKMSVDDERLVSLARKNDPLFFNEYQNAYPELVGRLLEINPKLSANELSFCAMIQLGFSSKEIAQYGFMQHRSVQTKKNRLRKKLHIPSDVDIYFFLQNLNSK